MNRRKDKQIAFSAKPPDMGVHKWNCSCQEGRGWCEIIFMNDHETQHGTIRWTSLTLWYKDDIQIDLSPPWTCSMSSIATESVRWSCLHKASPHLARRVSSILSLQNSNEKLYNYHIQPGPGVRPPALQVCAVAAIPGTGKYDIVTLFTQLLWSWPASRSCISHISTCGGSSFSCWKFRWGLDTAKWAWCITVARLSSIQVAGYLKRASDRFGSGREATLGPRRDRPQQIPADMAFEYGESNSGHCCHYRAHPSPCTQTFCKQQACQNPAMNFWCLSKIDVFKRDHRIPSCSFYTNSATERLASLLGNKQTLGGVSWR